MGISYWKPRDIEIIFSSLPNDWGDCEKILLFAGVCVVNVICEWACKEQFN